MRHRLRGQAVIREPALAVLAVPAGDVERQDDAVADLNLVDAVADLDDLAHVLVTEPRPVSKSVRPSYMCRSEPQMFVVVIRTSTSVGRSMRASARP